MSEHCDHRGASIERSRETVGNTTVVHYSCQRCGKNWDEYR